jgi:flagellar hook protein FlgE
MTLSSALSTAVSGLSAQSLALSTISKNIANASTTAYKSGSVDFQTLLGAAGDDSSVGGVNATAMTVMSQQGPISSTATGTNLAIDGAGFFVVSSNSNPSSSDYAFTRDGSFATDGAGNLVNDAGYYLEGYPTDAQGNVTANNTSSLSSLQTINLASIGGTAKATTQIGMSANLPANAVTGDTFTSSMNMVDSLGVSHTIGQTWTKTAANAWTVTLSNPTLTSDASVTTGTINPSSVDVTFDTNGVLASTNPSPVTLAVTGLTTGAADSSIAFSLGTVGKTDGLTQLASSTTPLALGSPTFTQDGALQGQVTGVTIDAKGLVTASFDNGVKLPIYQIPIASFTNPQGLASLGGTVYAQDTAAGGMTLNDPGVGTAGKLDSSSLEGSTTDIASEFNKMIVAQQAYSAASQVVTTVKSMFDTLTQSMR